jgi:23S rRNA (guanosine2251-2'-O)-methyltransferase
MSEKKVLIFGLHSVESLLKRNASAIYELLIQKDRQDKRMMQVIEMAKKQGLKPQTVTARTLDEKTQSGAHQGIMAICQPQDQLHEADLPAFLDSIEHPFILVLDGVQDPHNLGACLRSAEAAGVHLVIAPRDRAVGLTPVVRKVASGAAENIPFVQVTNLVRTLTLFKERGI